MIPTPYQIAQAARNHRQRPYAHGSRIKSALEHAKASRAYAAAVSLAQVFQAVQP